MELTGTLGFLRKIAGGRDEVYIPSPAYLAGAFAAGGQEAEAVLAELVTQGFLEPCGEGRYRLTAKARGPVTEERDNRLDSEENVLRGAKALLGLARRAHEWDQEGPYSQAALLDEARRILAVMQAVQK